MNFNYICTKCGKKHDPKTLIFKCPCGGMLDLDTFDISFSKDHIIKDEFSLFRYVKALPFDKNSAIWKNISMGEGLTPIIPLVVNNPNLLVKLDYIMPTLSFKDRGAAVLIAKAKELGVRKVVQDSSGNAGTSIAAYASRAGIECDIFVPKNTSKKKIQQISAYGANIHVIEGSREDTAKAALEVANGGEAFYASHVYNPFFYQGTKTYVYEVYEQLNGKMPDILVAPVGNGTLVLGLYYGLKDLLNAGLISKLPQIIAVQSQNCAPIYKAFIEGKDSLDKIETTHTMAEGIAIAEPKRGEQILAAIRETKGRIIISPEDEIPKTMEFLSNNGFFVEPTTAATLAAYNRLAEQNTNLLDKKVLIPLCGSGLKSD